MVPGRSDWLSNALSSQADYFQDPPVDAKGITTYQVLVQPLEGPTITIDISKDDNTETIKGKISVKDGGIPADLYELRSNGKPLEGTNRGILIRAVPLHALPGGGPKLGSTSITKKKLDKCVELEPKRGGLLREKWEGPLQELIKKRKNATGKEKEKIDRDSAALRETLTTGIQNILDSHASRAGVRLQREVNRHLWLRAYLGKSPPTHPMWSFGLSTLKEGP